MHKIKKTYQAITIPTSGTFRLVPESDFVEISDVIIQIQFLSLPSASDLTLGYLLKHHREAKELSQEQLSKLTGIGQKHISNIEKGETSPRWSTLQKLFRHLDKKFELGVKYFWELNESKKRVA